MVVQAVVAVAIDIFWLVDNMKENVWRATWVHVQALHKKQGLIKALL